MTIIKCIECKSPVSTTAASCPRCGAVAFAPPPKPAPPTADPEQYATAAKVLLGVIMLVVVALPVKCAIDAPKRRAAAAERKAAFEEWKTNGPGGKALRALSAEKKVIDAAWFSEGTLWIGVWDDGSRRDGYAQAMCEAISIGGWHGDAYIHVGDNRALQAGDLKEIGRYHCKR